MKPLPVLALLLGIAAPSVAQQARGVVSDSASRIPIPGAVLLLLDSTGVVLGRNITNERGQYTVALTSAMRRLRVQRIGFRPREVPVPPTTTGVATIDVAMVSLPTFLEPVRVTANACRRRSDQGSALALLEQARAGLLTTVVAREAKPGSLVLFIFERTMDGTSDRIQRQTVRVDSARRRAKSFSAVHNAQEFVRRGFMADGIDGQIFYAPDADVLLHDAFAAGYCFRVVEPNRSRANQVGLGFAAADRRGDRVDIDGVLWIDTAARALRDIEFRYVGLAPQIERYEPGGTISFREMSNGVVLVDRWSLRLVGARHDTVQSTALERPMDRASGPRVDLTFYGHESGGELAHAAWPDGTQWHAPLGTLDLRAIRRSGAPASGVRAWLVGTPYRATADSAGRLTIADLVPGPYALVVEDTALRQVNLTIPTGVSFTSRRDSSRLVAKVPSVNEFLLDQCRLEARVPNFVGDTTHALARVTTSDGTPLGDVRWVARMNRRPEIATYQWFPVRSDIGRTGTNGLIPICPSQSGRDAMLEIDVWRDGMSHTIVRRRLTDAATLIPIVLGRP